MLACVHNTCVWCHAGPPPNPSPIGSDTARASRFRYFFTRFIMNHSFLSTIYKMFVSHKSPGFLTRHRPLLLWTTLLKPEVLTSYEASQYCRRRDQTTETCPRRTTQTG